MYTFDSRVRYSETGEDGLLSLPAIVDYFQDASTFQSEDLGIGIDFLKEKDLLWVMSAWQVVVHRYPASEKKSGSGRFHTSCAALWDCVIFLWIRKTESGWHKQIRSGL